MAWRKCIDQAKLDYFVKYIFPWIMYEFISLTLFIPALVFGAMSVDDKCVNNIGIISAYTWLFVYMAAVLLLNGSFAPIIYLFIKMDVKMGVSKKHIASFIISMVFVVFMTSWSGVGIHLYRQTQSCSYDLIARAVLSLSVVWICLIGICALAALIACIVLVFTL